jgi:hypothetical protein
MEDRTADQDTLTEFNDKVQRGLYRSALVAGEDMRLTEVVSYLTKTWNYLYTSLLDVGIQVHAMNFRNDEEVIKALEEIRGRLFDSVTGRVKEK